MLSTDDIFRLSAVLSSDGAIASALSRQLRAVHGLPSYQAWLGTLAEAEPFALPGSVDTALLEKLHLIREGRLLVKVNSTGDGVFMTDGVWVDPSVRVFPFSDESITLIRFVRSIGLKRPAQWTLDLATGSGINAMALGGRSLAFDINPRALAYAAANRMINRISGKDCVLALNDIRDGIPSTVVRNLNGDVLILANMPFGPTPSPDALPLTSSGGESGADLQIATYRAMAELVRSAQGRFSFRAFLMGLTIGDRAADRWEIVKHAVEFFGQDHVRWHLLSDEHVFRIDGKRRLGNPASVAVALPELASCRLYTPDKHDRAAKIAAFSGLAKRHEARGKPDIAYGIVEVTSAF